MQAGEGSRESLVNVAGIQACAPFGEHLKFTQNGWMTFRVKPPPGLFHLPDNFTPGRPRFPGLPFPPRRCSITPGGRMSPVPAGFFAGKGERFPIFIQNHRRGLGPPKGNPLDRARRGNRRAGRWPPSPPLPFQHRWSPRPPKGDFKVAPTDGPPGPGVLSGARTAP